MESEAHKNPTAKTAMTANFRWLAKFSFQTAIAGNRKIEKSETMFIADVAMIRASGDRQVPGIEGFEILDRGRQAKIKPNQVVK